MSVSSLPSLANYLTSNASYSSDYLTSRAQSSDSSGSSSTATLLDSATSTQDQIAIAYRLANKLKLQANTDKTGGNSSNVTSLTTQASQIISTLSNNLSSVTTLNSSSQTALGNTMNSLNAVLATLASLAPQGGADVSRSIATTIESLQSQASGLAKLAGVSWSPISVSTGASSASSNASSTNGASNAASGLSRLLDITV